MINRLGPAKKARELCSGDRIIYDLGDTRWSTNGRVSNSRMGTVALARPSYNGYETALHLENGVRLTVHDNAIIQTIISVPSTEDA